MFFPKHGISSLDAVVLTHGHADALLGLDDLRMWGNADDEDSGKLPVHLDRSTLKVVSSMFPYLVNVASSTGGGGVASLDFRVFEEELPEVEVAGLRVLPIKGPFPFFSLSCSSLCH